MNLTDEQTAKINDPNHPIFAVLERLKLVEEGLLKQDPLLPTHMKTIHKELGQYEELAHLLTPAQIGILMKGLQKLSAITLVMEKPKSSRTKAEKVNVDDLM